MARSKKSKKNTSKKFFSLFSLGFLMSVLLTFLTFLGGSFFVWSDNRVKVDEALQKFSREVNVSSSSSIRNTLTKPVKVYDQKNELIGEFYKKNYKPIRVDNLKAHSTLVWSLLSSEDRAFYEHGGVNYKALLRAIYINATSGKFAQGGSTITQQLAKLSLNLGERNIFNKITETFCAYYIELNYDKDTILTMYMNQIFMGEGNFGLEAASQYYFGKSAYLLSPAESALLVGVIPAPSLYNPVRNLEKAIERQDLILKSMSLNQELYNGPLDYKNNFDDTKISKEKLKFKSTYSIKKGKGEKSKYSSKIGSFGYDRDFSINHAPEFNDVIRSTIINMFDSEELESKDLAIYTSLDLSKQRLAQQFLLEGVNIIKADLEKRKQQYIQKKNDEEAQREKEIIDGMNGALVSINPANGFVEAYVGAVRLNSIYRLNRAEDARRQPGSAIKGFIYALALEKRIINPSSVVTDEKIDFNGYSPKNWYSGFKGKMTAREALGLSVNTVTVKLLKEIGVSVYLDTLAQILHTTSSDLKDRFDNNLSLALGTGELSPFEMALLYATIASGGRKIYPKKILRIVDEKTGEEIFNDEYQPETVDVPIDPIACAMAVNMMGAVLSEQGTMLIKQKAGKTFPMAGKTGTTQIPASIRKKWGNRNGVRDVWFAGITPNLATTIWIGNDAGAPFPGSGAGNAGPVWKRYVNSFQVPMDSDSDLVVEMPDDGFVRVDICGDTGELLSESEGCKYPLYKQFYYTGDEPKVSKADLDSLLNPEKHKVPLEENDGGSQVDPSYFPKEEDIEEN
jgi:penicillin-binding protein 1A